MFVPREGVSGPLRAVVPHPESELVAEAEEPPQHGERLNLYRYPVLYDALKTPAADDVAILRQVMERFVGPGPWHMLDPACGPGNWLKPFADGRNSLVGNDFCRDMVEWAKLELEGKRCRAVHGDMYHLELGHERFDLVFEASGVTSIVPNLRMLTDWLEQLGQYLNRDGAIVLLFNFTTPLPERFPHLLWRTPWQDIPGGGVARLQYELLRDLPAKQTQHIQRTVTTRGVPDAPLTIAEDYELRIWTPAELEGLKKGLSSLEVVSMVEPYTVGGPEVSHAEGERYVVFRRRDRGRG